MSSTHASSCPECGTGLIVSPDSDLLHAAPWCPDCEWNLDHFTADPGVSWFWNRIHTADQRAGYRSDQLLARSGTASPVTRSSFVVLAAVSAVLLLVMAALVVTGVWLIVVGGQALSFVFGLLLIVLAVLIRPRFARLKPMLENSYRLTPGERPAVDALISRVATEISAPKPDVLLFDFSWNAGVVDTGILRRQRVMVLGVPLLLALRPQEVVALIGHELGHLKYADSLRSLLTQPARTTFGRLGQLVRPPLVSAVDNGIGFHLIVLFVWTIVGGTLAVFFYAIHRKLNAIAARDNRTVELRADEAAAHAGGTEAALRLQDVMAMLPLLTTLVQHHVPRNEAARQWRRMLSTVRDRDAATVTAWRQLSNRTDASLWASHPAPGRRHQWLSARPHREAAVMIDEADAERLEREIVPYAEALHRTMLKHTTEEPH
ncbi:MAG: M48 family metalloprotease [Actinomycetota bacterium]|nr:M48 family metalloprotease [Actinomycetota bacterium]